MLAALGSPQRSFEVVLVAGTNGKGSTASVLAACLTGSGRRTGLFVSPHLHHVGERAMIDGVATSPVDMEAALAAVRPHAERLNATFFEVITVACAVLFKRAGVKVAVMEVGLGGRLDATNALEPALSIITGVDLDHVAVLGADVSTIAAEKAGILREGVPALTAASGAALTVIESEAARLRAPLDVVGSAVRVAVLDSSWSGLELVVTGLCDAPDTELRLRTPLVGRHQAENVALAVAGAVALRVPRSVVAKVVAATTWPGRLERFEHHGRHVVLDGAHNPQAAAALAGTIRELGGGCDVLVLGFSADKDHHEILKALTGVARRVVVTRAVRSPRASDPSHVAALVKDVMFGVEPTVSVAATPAAALNMAAASAEAGGTIVVAGSLFLVGEVRSLLLGLEDEVGERWQ